MPEGAADEEVLPVSRGQPGDGSETNERSYPARRDVPRYKSDRNNDVSASLNVTYVIMTQINQINSKYNIPSLFVKIFK